MSSVLQESVLDETLPELEPSPGEALRILNDAMSKFDSQKSYINYAIVCQATRQCWGTTYGWWLDRGRCDEQHICDFMSQLNKAIGLAAVVEDLEPGTMEAQRVIQYQFSMNHRLGELFRLDKSASWIDNGDDAHVSATQGVPIPTTDRTACAKCLLLAAGCLGLLHELVQITRELQSEAGPAICSCKEHRNLFAHAFSRAAILLSDSEKIPGEILPQSESVFARTEELRHIILTLRQMTETIKDIATWPTHKEAVAQTELVRLGDAAGAEPLAKARSLYLFFREALPREYRSLYLDRKPISVVRWAARLLAAAKANEPFFPTKTLTELVASCQMPIYSDAQRQHERNAELLRVPCLQLGEKISLEVENIIDSIASRHGFSGEKEVILADRGPILCGIIPDFCDQLNYGLELDRSRSSAVIDRLYAELHAFFALTLGNRPWGRVIGDPSGRISLKIDLKSKRFQPRDLEKCNWVSTRAIFGD